ncbi:MAG: helix-turn-helix domain-containing protein [Nitratireductor sp.]
MNHNSITKFVIILVQCKFILLNLLTMNKKRISLIRAHQARPFINTARRLGAPVNKLAKQTGLPLEAVKSGEGVIGEPVLWDFVVLVSQTCQCDLYGYYTALDHPVNQTGQLGDLNVVKGQSLKEILDILIKDVVNESDNCEYQLLKKNGDIWFTRELPWKHNAGWIAEQYVISFIIQIVRLCAPGDWLPSHIRIATRDKPVHLPAEWESVSIDWGWSRTEVRIENELLKFTPRFPPTKNILSTQKLQQSKMLIEDMIDRQIWSSQISRELLAHELGMSISTLNRLLSKMGTSYSQILANRRIFHADKLLISTDLKVSQIARMIGYSTVSNFSRAYFNETGKYPSELRKLRESV